LTREIKIKNGDIITKIYIRMRNRRKWFGKREKDETCSE